MTNYFFCNIILIVGLIAAHTVLWFFISSNVLVYCCQSFFKKLLTTDVFYDMILINFDF